ncbi:heme ABC exporter ATP-binding protein CcmA [Neisseriaceae bacterium B1]
MSNSLLEVKELSVQRGRNVLFQNFSCSLNQGECVWLKGRNGGGKTSLLLTLCGLLPPYSGDIFWEGKAFDESDVALNQLWHYCPHQPTLKNNWTLVENFQAALALNNMAYNSEAAQIEAKKWEIDSMLNMPVRHLSQGQRRRAAFVRLALLPFRPVWLLDEPFDALDSHAQQLLAMNMNAHLQQNGAIIMTSHFQPPSFLSIHREVTLVSAS